MSTELYSSVTTAVISKAQNFVLMNKILQQALMY